MTSKMQQQQQTMRPFRADEANTGQQQPARRDTTNALRLGRTNANQPAALIYQPQLQQTLTNITNRRHQMPLGSKDLIIRMLAEVFQVKQDESGQMRWHQVSTSLVPISLYSRTTSKWLDYLLTVPLSMQANDPANTMSPDSRNFLLLLQQFHQQTRVGGQQQLAPLESETPIVFQVVGHDFIEGQFRKILNVKIRQPGTRLGQASDYFVYWRDQTQAKHFNQLSHQQFSASSYASNASFMHQQPAAAPLKQPNQTQMLNPMNVNQQAHFDRYPQQHLTWGLNFASMNDAKLFFDICSLNIVNLDFNSEYLKQLSISDGRFRQLARLSPSSLMLGQQRRSQQQHQLAARTVSIQQQQRLARGKLARSKLRQDYQLEALRHQTCSRQAASSSRCSACREPQTMQTTAVVNANEFEELADSRPCPVHGQSSGRGGALRARSRSTTRQPLSSMADLESKTNLRARSFSTPASPEPCDQLLRTTQRRRHRTNTEMDPRERSQTLEWQKRQFKCQTTADGGRPEKPARGLLRPAHLLGSQESCNGAKRRQQAVTSDRLLHSKPNVKARYMGYLHNAQQQRSGGGAQSAHATDQRAASNMQDRSLFRSVAQNELESSFDTHRDARVARAQYARSRNMKEFLSLDAGGQQQLGQFGAQSDQQQRPQQSRRPVVRQLTDNSNGKNNGRHHQEAPKARLPPMKSMGKSSNAQHPVPKSTPKLRPTPLVAAGDNDANVCTNSNGANSAQCNAATTTDDLPMDSSTRKRMFKLTSDEVISERTEPASLSVWAQASDERQQQLQRLESGEDGREFPQRAVSLGPDENNKFRGRRARSDAGRRRSLERSGCVDFDSASSFMKQAPARLSPLPQSLAASPHQALSDDIRLNENSTGLTDKTYAAADDGFYRETHQADGTLAMAAHHHSDRLTPTDHSNRSRTTKLVESGGGGQFVTAATMASDDASKPRQMFSSEHFHQHLATFKSAPDISQLVEESPGGQNAHWPLHCDECDNDDAEDDEAVGTFESPPRRRAVEVAVASEQQRWRRHHFEANSNPAPRAGHSLGRPNLSSYAVPLCATVKRLPLQQHHHHQQAAARRQCHSCPNSLRRKRPPPSLVNATDLIHRHHRPELESQLDNCCSCQHCQRERVARQDTAATTTLCACCEPLDCVATNCTAAHLIANRHEHNCLANQTLQCRHNTHHHHRPALHHHHHHLPDQVDQSSFRRTGSTSRPASSQSVRSPMQYGLYESECDDEEENDEQDRNIDDEDLSSPIVCWSQQQRKRLNTGDVVKPVHGYDQTMLRPSAKSRQRSKSQPPGGGGDQEEPPSENSAQHLTKSMETVEKLIKEVQNELRQLKRQPLGAAQIDLKSSTSAVELREPVDEVYQPTNNSKASAPGGGDQQRQQSSPKMSQEEKETGSKRALSYSSATRRAGQFKCVGAIRKAGFLSVKKWILKRRQSIELARKQGWKRYWVCLRGTALLFHSVLETKPAGQQAEQATSQQQDNQQKQIDLATWIRLNCSSQLQSVASLLRLEQQGDRQPESISLEGLLESMSQCYIEEEPRHLIIIDGSIAQPIPEHPRRDFVFCLSTTFGDAYLFQASCQLESDNWLSAIHNACAASIARDLVRDEAIKLFVTKIRHFELEAEKKLFLRHRLESRLTSMSSIMSNSSGRVQAERQEGGKKSTMRSLLHQLSQQLLALDTYIEQLQCEIYQLRCYLSSCNAQNLFYNNLSNQVAPAAPLATSHQSLHDLPHPKSLLMHVSKPTKLLLIKLGVFTVSSFHAFIHARQESAKSIFKTIEQQQQLAGSTSQTSAESPLFELRIRSQSISETLQNAASAAKGPNNVQLANETESLIEMADLKTLPIVLTRALFNKIKRGPDETNEHQLDQEPAETSDDRYSIHNFAGQSIKLNVRLNSNSNSSSIIKQVLKIIRPDVGDLDFLNYYLRLVTISATNSTESDTKTGQKEEYFVVKRRETQEDWSNFVHLELLEKIVFRVELSRSQMDEDETTAPFGISVEGQLLQGRCESQLNVYCSYIEWGSSADKAGLQDEDELLMVNGVPVADLDLMFVECIIQEASKLRAIVRSSRCKCPARSRQLDQINWRSLDDDGDGGGGADGQRELDPTENKDNLNSQTNSRQMNRPFNSQIMSDEYLTSLVCPPPPAKSSAFLRETNLLRRKSDLGLDRANANDDEDDDDQVRVGDQLNAASSMAMTRAISQHGIDSMDEPTESNQAVRVETMRPTSGLALRSSAELARQLIRNTERITRLLEKESPPVAPISCEISSPVEMVQARGSQQNQIERVKKSILELIETEYAYIRHLETINEHYLSPLCETSFLNLFDLNSFSQIVLALLRFQNEFFSMLTKGIFDSISSCLVVDSTRALVLPSGDDFERFNWIVQQMDSFESVTKFKPVLSSIAQVFLSEVQKFKIYAPYCVAYSKLQRILHPKNANQASTFQNSTTITSIPSTLNTFANSSANSMNNLSQINSSQNHRDLKLFNLIGGVSNGAAAAAADERHNQLKQLTEFLNNLDSSSSSASLSLQQSQRQDSKASSLIVSTNLDLNSQTTPNYQKSVHHQNFESYLIKPIQRIVKYPMLLNSIALACDANQTTGDDGGSDDEQNSSEQLQVAIKQLESVINHVNDSQRVHDEYGQLFEHIERQFFELQALDSNKNLVANLFGPHQPPITLNIGQLLYSGPVDWLNLSEFSSKPSSKKLAINQLSSVLFVFESCVVFVCKGQQSAKSTSGKRLKLLSKTNETSAEPAQQSSGGMTSRVFQWSTGSLATSNGSGRDGSDAHEVVRYHTLIPVSEVQVRSVSSSSVQDDDDQDEESSGRQFRWELFQCSSSNSNSSLLTSKSSKQLKTQQPKQQQQRRNSNTGKVYLLSSVSNEQRSTFLRKIRFIIRESVRNMSLPPLTSNKSSLSNKSTTTGQKKLSTSSASSNTSNTNVNTSMSLSPAESSGRPDCVTQDQSTTIKFEPYNTKQVHEVKT